MIIRDTLIQKVRTAFNILCLFSIIHFIMTFTNKMKIAHLGYNDLPKMYKGWNVYKNDDGIITAKNKNLIIKSIDSANIYDIIDCN